MEPYKLGEMEQRFADLIWEHAPIASGELVKLCEQAIPVPCISLLVSSIRLSQLLCIVMH